MKHIVKELCAREGKRSQVSIGNMREIMGHLADMVYEMSFDDLHDFLQELMMYGEKRAQKKRKKPKK